MNTFTKRITSSQTITINASDGVMSLSVEAAPSGGSFNFLGSYEFKGITPSNLILTDGESISLIASSTSKTLSGITIQWVSGIVNVLISVS